MDARVVSKSWLLWTTLQRTRRCTRLWETVISFPSYTCIPRSGTAGSSSFRFLRHFHISFHNGHTNKYSMFSDVSGTPIPWVRSLQSEHLKTHLCWVPSPFLKPRMKRREVITGSCAEWVRTCCLKQVTEQVSPGWLLGLNLEGESMDSSWNTMALGCSPGVPLKQQHKWESSIKRTPYTT